MTGRLSIALVAALALAGCTIRYSQTMVGRITRVSGASTSNSSSGSEIGLGYPGASSLVLTLQEPKSAEDLAAAQCEAVLTQVDYRGTWFSFYVAYNAPKVETTAYCVSK